MEAFVEAPVEVTSVEALISSISSMEASTVWIASMEDSMKAFVEVTSMKASITSAKLPVLPRKLGMEAFVEVT